MILSCSPVETNGMERVSEDTGLVFCFGSSTKIQIYVNKTLIVLYFLKCYHALTVAEDVRDFFCGLSAFVPAGRKRKPEITDSDPRLNHGKKRAALGSRIPELFPTLPRSK